MVQLGTELHRDSVEQEHRGQGDGDGCDARIAIERGQRPGRGAHQRGHREADRAVAPKEVGALVWMQLRGLQCGEREPEVADHIGNADNAGDHRDEPEVGWTEQPREHNEREQLKRVTSPLAAQRQSALPLAERPCPVGNRSPAHPARKLHPK